MYAFLMIAYFIICALSAWVAKIHFGKKWPDLNWTLLSLGAGALPTGLTILGLALWDGVARYQYFSRPQEEGYMGPLVILIYGALFFVLSFCLNMAVAFFTGRKA